AVGIRAGLCVNVPFGATGDAFLGAEFRARGAIAKRDAVLTIRAVLHALLRHPGDVFIAERLDANTLSGPGHRRVDALFGGQRLFEPWRLAVLRVERVVYVAEKAAVVVEEPAAEQQGDNQNKDDDFPGASRSLASRL